MKKFRFQPFKGDKEKEHRGDPETVDGAMNTDDSGNSEEAGNIEETVKPEEAGNPETTEETGNSDGAEDSGETEDSENPEEIQVNENSENSKETEETGESDKPEETVETGESDKPEGQRIADLLEEIERLKKEVVTARAEGEIAGRNARIEELIVTDEGDGLPEMSPAALSTSRADSIFSLAARAR